MPTGTQNDALIQMLQAIIGQLGGDPAAGRAAAGIAPPGPAAPTPTPPPPADNAPMWQQEPERESQMYRRFGLPKERLMFMQDLADFMAGMKFRQNALQSALAGKAGLFGDTDVMPGLPTTPGGLGQYA